MTLSALNLTMAGVVIAAFTAAFAPKGATLEQPLIRRTLATALLLVLSGALLALRAH